MTQSDVDSGKLAHIREVHASIEAVSPLSPHEDNDNTWLKMYLGLVHLPQDLKAYLITLYYMDISYTVLDDCLLDILARGNRSSICDHLQRFWIEYYRHMWGSRRGKDILGRSPVIGDYVHVPLGYKSGSSPMMKELKVNLLREMSGGGKIPDQSYAANYFFPRKLCLSKILCSRFMDGDFSLEWSEIAEIITDTPRIQRGAICSSLAIDAMESAMAVGYFPNNVPVTQDVKKLYHALITEQDSSQDLGIGIMESQEIFSMDKMREFASLMEQYNLEWAMASFDWSGEGESSCLAMMRRIVGDFPLGTSVPGVVEQH